MKTFYFVRSPSHKRGMDVMVKAYRVKKNDPIYLGYQDYCHAANKGAFAIACDIIADSGEAKLAADGYGLVDRDTKVIEL